MLEAMDEATGQPVKHMVSVVFSAAEWYGNQDEG